MATKKVLPTGESYALPEKMIHPCKGCRVMVLQSRWHMNQGKTPGWLENLTPTLSPVFGDVHQCKEQV